MSRPKILEQTCAIHTPTLLGDSVITDVTYLQVTQYTM